MGQLALVAMLAGTALSASGEQKQAKAAHDAAIYNARLAKMQADQEARRVREVADINQGINITRIAKSGVRMEGSPLDVLVSNSFQAAKQANNIIRAGEAQSQLLRMEAKNATEAGKYAVGSTVLQGIGSAYGGSSFTFAGGAGNSGAYGGGYGAGLYRPNFAPFGGAVPLRRR